jgi:hypothetical protein
LDQQGVHHGADVKDKTHSTTPGKPSLGTDTAGSSSHKPSIGERIKGSLFCFPYHPNIENKLLTFVQRSFTGTKFSMRLWVTGYDLL